jgi:hypothetical protein
VLDRILVARDAFAPKAGFVIDPASSIVLNPLENHPQPSSTEATIDLEVPERSPNFFVVRPVLAVATLAGQEAAHDITTQFAK